MTQPEGGGDRGDIAGLSDGVTLESPFRGRVRIYQPKKGYRYSIDAFLLVDFALRSIIDLKRKKVVAAELGSGSGVVSMGLALSPAIEHVTGIEIIPELVYMSRRSADSSGLGKKVGFIEGDLKNPTTAGIKYGSFDLVVSNPPYRPVGEGRVSPDFTKAVARHEIASTVDDVSRSASKLLKNEGSLCLIYIPERLPELLMRLQETGMEPVRLRFVHPRPAGPARMALVEALKSSSKGMEVEPPMFVHNEDGNYTAEMEAAFEGPK